MSDIDETANRIHQTARDHGFWDKDRNLGEMLMLVASELAECLEEDRAGKGHVYFKCTLCGWTTHDVSEVTDDHYIPVPPRGLLDKVLSYFGYRGWLIQCDSDRPLKPEGALVEVADAIIRLFDTGHDMASKTKYTLAEIIGIKMDYNDQREHKHGKAY